MGKIKVWISEPGKNPRHTWISNTLKNLQKTVEGYIEHYALSPDLGIICNEEGMFRDCKYNCTIDNQQFFGIADELGANLGSINSGLYAHLDSYCNGERFGKQEAEEDEEE